MKLICDVCGKEEECQVVCSCFGAFSIAICDECLQTGKENYNSMVSYIADAGKFPEDINPAYQSLVRHQLELHNKTEEEFINDVNTCINRRYAFFN